MKLKDVRDGFIVTHIGVALIALGVETIMLGTFQSWLFFLLVPTELVLIGIFAIFVTNRMVYGNWRGEIR